MNAENVSHWPQSAKPIKTKEFCKTLNSKAYIWFYCFRSEYKLHFLYCCFFSHNASLQFFLPVILKKTSYEKNRCGLKNSRWLKYRSGTQKSFTSIAERSSPHSTEQPRKNSFILRQILIYILTKHFA